MANILDKTSGRFQFYIKDVDNKYLKAFRNSKFELYERTSAPFIARYSCEVDFNDIIVAKTICKTVDAPNEDTIIEQASSFYNEVLTWCKKDFAVVFIIEKTDEPNYIQRRICGYIANLSIKQNESYEKSTYPRYSLTFELENIALKGLKKVTSSDKDKTVIEEIKDLFEKDSSGSNKGIEVKADFAYTDNNGPSDKDYISNLKTNKFTINRSRQNQLGLIDDLCNIFHLNYNFDYQVEFDSNILNSKSLSDHKIVKIKTLVYLGNSYKFGVNFDVDKDTYTSINFQKAGSSLKAAFNDGIEVVTSSASVKSLFEEKRNCEKIALDIVDAEDYVVFDNTLSRKLRCDKDDILKNVSDILDDSYQKAKDSFQTFLRGKTFDAILVPGCKIKYQNRKFVVFENVLKFEEIDGKYRYASRFVACPIQSDINSYLGSLTVLQKTIFNNSIKRYDEQNNLLGDSFFLSKEILDRVKEKLFVQKNDVIDSSNFLVCEVCDKSGDTKTNAGKPSIVEQNNSVMPNVFWAKVSKENTVIRVNLVSFLQSEKVATCPVIGETVLVVVSNGEYYLQGFITNHVQSLSKDNTLNPTTVRFGLKDFVDKRNLADSSNSGSPSDPDQTSHYKDGLMFVKYDDIENYIEELKNQNRLDDFKAHMQSHNFAEFDQGKNTFKQAVVEAKTKKNSDGEYENKYVGSLVDSKNSNKEGKLYITSLIAEGELNLDSDNNVNINTKNQLNIESQGTHFHSKGEIKISSDDSITLSVCGTKITIDAFGINLEATRPNTVQYAIDQNKNLNDVGKLAVNTLASLALGDANTAALTLNAYNGMSCSVNKATVNSQTQVELNDGWGGKLCLNYGNAELTGCDAKIQSISRPSDKTFGRELQTVLDNIIPLISTTTASSEWGYLSDNPACVGKLHADGFSLGGTLQLLNDFTGTICDICETVRDKEPNIWNKIFKIIIYIAQGVDALIDYLALGLPEKNAFMHKRLSDTNYTVYDLIKSIIHIAMHQKLLKAIINLINSYSNTTDNVASLDVCREKTVLQGKEIEIAGTKEITNLVHPQLP